MFLLLTRFFVLVFFGLPAWPAAAAPAPKTFALGPFTVSVVDETRAGASETAVYVDHAERDARTQGHLWSARAGDGCSFVAAASGSFDAVQDSGNFQFTDTPGPQSTGQTIDTVRPVAAS